MIYVLSTPDWQEAKSQTDLYLVSMREGVDSTRQMTFTKTKNESSPRWASDGRAFFFLSNREAPSNAENRNQLYMMRPDGGEAQRLTETDEGVRDYQTSARTAAGSSTAAARITRSSCIVCRWRIEPGTAEQSRSTTGVGTWRFAPDDAHLLPLAGPRRQDEKARREKKFTVNIRNMETPSASLWTLDLGDRATRKLTDGTQYAATAVHDVRRWQVGGCSAGSR
jgi:dipeptidyl aminopeptidase/acylaminoacyl peptidase